MTMPGTRGVASASTRQAWGWPRVCLIAATLGLVYSTAARADTAATTPAPTPAFGQGPCVQSIELLLTPPLETALAIANDASSNLNLDAQAVLARTTGYPGQVGDYDECAKASLFLEGAAAMAPLETHLCLAGSLSMNATAGLVPFGGLCVPEACEPEEMETRQFREWLEDKHADLLASPVSTDTQRHFVSNLLNHCWLADAMFQGFTCGTYQRPKYGADAWAVTGGLLLLCGFVCFATVRDLFRGPDYPDTGMPMYSNIPSPQVIKYAGPNEVYTVQEDHIGKYLAAFSVSRNLRRLFTVHEATELSVFDGMRVISMLWVVLGHTGAVQTSVGYINPEAMWPPNGMISLFVGQLFFSARFSVDTFFFVSGFLVVHAMLRKLGPVSGSSFGNKKRAKLWRSLPLFYVHRFLRITPPYIFSLLIWWKLAVFMGQGPFWYRWEYFISLCDQFWWSNLLYINNMVPWHAGETAECFYHTWYLANDMQFYIVSPVFIWLYMRRGRWGFISLGLALLASVVAMAVGTFVRGWSALSFDGSWVVRYSEETYTMPYFRIVPYLAGMMFAMFWREKQIRWPQYKLGPWMRVLMLGASVFLLLMVTFSAWSGYQRYPCPVSENPDTKPCGSQWPLWLLSIYNSLTRPAWALGLALMCFVCFVNQGGLIQQLLAHRGWVPLARLSFGAYLLHPLVINLWFLNSTTKFHFSQLDFWMDYICVATVTWGGSLVMALLVESPLSKLAKYFEESLHHPRRTPAYDAANQSPGSLSIERHELAAGGWEGSKDGSPAEGRPLGSEEEEEEEEEEEVHGVAAVHAAGATRPPPLRAGGGGGRPQGQRGAEERIGLVGLAGGGNGVQHGYSTLGRKDSETF